MPDGINDLCRFYADQYGMIFHTVYDPLFFTIKGEILFRNTRKNYCIRCAGLSDKEIIGHLHSIIYDVLVEEGMVLKYGNAADQTT